MSSPVSMSFWSLHRELSIHAVRSFFLDCILGPEVRLPFWPVDCTEVCGWQTRGSLDRNEVAAEGE